ncbi:MAG: hypothetical protein QM831_13845 [Kofleriaceae bacterium]
MSNHIHIAAIAGQEPLSHWSRRANLPFAQWTNEQKRRIGPVFANRASDWAVAPERVPALIAYLHNNPVRAGVVKSASESNWTSHRFYLGQTAPRWLHVDDGLAVARHTASEFDGFVNGHPDDPTRENGKRVRAALQVLGNLNVGTPFEHEVPLVRRPFARVRPHPKRVLQVVAEELSLDEANVASRLRHPKLRDARALVIRCGLAAGLTGADLASVLGISRQSVSWVVHNMKSDSTLVENVLDRLRDEYSVVVPG